MVQKLKELVDHTEIAVALDYYKLEDDFTEIGSLVRDLKYYRVDQIKLEKLTDFFVDYVRNHIQEKIDMIVPIPSFNPRTPSNPAGEIKIMYLLAERLSENLNIPLDVDSVSKSVNKQAKNGLLLKGDIESERFLSNTHNRNILLLDDLYGSGDSAKLTIEAIKENNPKVKIFLVAATRNKFGGLPREVCANINYNRGIKKSETNKDYITLNFMYNGANETVILFEDHPRFIEVKDLYDKNVSRHIALKIKKGINGYWNVSSQ